MIETESNDRSVPTAFQEYGREELDHSPAFGHGKNGICDVTLARESESQTRLLNEYVKVPYHLTGTLDDLPPAELITLCLQEPTGGIAQGDRHRLTATAQTDAYCHITTQSASKVHSMPANYAHLDASLSADTGAYLTYLPGPTILNEQARCLQTITVDLPPDAVIVVGDVVVPDGLTAHAPFDFDHYHSRIEARVDGEMVCLDTVDLVPEDQPLQNPAVMGEYAVIGSLYLFAPQWDLSALVDRIRTQLAAGDQIYAGLSALPDNAGVTVRMLGERSTDMQSMIASVSESIRDHLLCSEVIN